MYVNLAIKSDYSFMEGASKIKDYVLKAKQIGAPALAITDRNNLFGAYEFSKIAKSEKIKPIIGTQMPLMYDKENGSYGYLTFLAQNEAGYKNISKIMCDAQDPKHNKGNSYTLLAKTLMEASDNIIVLSGGNDGLLPNMLKKGELDKAREIATFLSNLLGDRFYIQINRNKINDPANIEIEKQLLDIAFNSNVKIQRENGELLTSIPVVATSDTLYAEEHRHDAYEILHAIDTSGKASIDDNGIERKDNNNYSFKDFESFEKLFSDMPNAVENTNQIANRCSFLVEGRDPILPAFETEGGRTEDQELKSQAFEGLDKRLEGKNITQQRRDEYEDRLNYELGIIENMGFPGYFLIVADFIKWAKQNDIPVGPGRGSGAGSLVAYCLTITDLDPFQFGLLFERFLNPERVSMPDFDIDFCQDRREEVIKYVQGKYGVDKVSQIATFGEIKAKNAIKDAGRVIIHDKFGGYGFGETNEYTKLIPKKEDSAEPKSLAEAFETTPELQEKLRESEKFNVLYQNARKIEGLYRTSGSHAAGVIIGDRTLHELVPLKWDENTGMPLSQFNMKGAESVGLVKFDFLGLKTLSVIKETIDLVKENRGISIDIDNLDLYDDQVYGMLREGRSNGVFQFESGGMQNVLKQVKPTRIEDLIAVNALYRPGPMDQIDHYAACKNGEAEPHYPNPVERTKPFLEETFGIMVYQEQVMKVAQEVAGYSLGGADLLRRAMGKKIKSEMDAQKEMFVKGAYEKGIPEKESSNLFDTIAKFAGYGFNKSHAAAYAYIAYQTAWLKRYYTSEFFSALLSYETAKPERMALIKEDMDGFNIQMLPPNINKSHARFRPEKHEQSRDGYAIRFGFNAIKQMSGNLTEFSDERKTGEFSDLRDFTKRAFHFFNKGKIDKLVEAGAFDCINTNRRATAEEIAWHVKSIKEETLNQGDLFGGASSAKVPDHIANTQDWGNKIDREYNAVGFYFHNHPIDHYLPRLKKGGIKRLSSIKEYMQKYNISDLPNLKLCVMVELMFPRYSRNNKLYINTKVSEKGDTYDVPFFGNRDMTVEQAQEILGAAKNNRTPVVIEANITLDDNGEKLRIFGKQVHAVDEYLENIRGDIILTLDTDQIMLRSEEIKMQNTAQQQFANGIIDQTQLDNAMQQIFVKKTSSRISELKAYLEDIRFDDLENGVGAYIILKSGDTILEQGRLDGKYHFNTISENHIKTMDGIVSVSEQAV